MTQIFYFGATFPATPLPMDGQRMTPTLSVLQVVVSMVVVMVSLLGLTSRTLGAQSWQALPEMPHGLRGAAATAGPDGNIYLVGGEPTLPKGGPAQAGVFRYNPSSRQWSELTNGLNVSRSYHSLVTGCDGTIYAIGGRNGSSPKWLDSVETFQPLIGPTWTRTNPLGIIPYVAAVGSDCKVYAIGVNFGKLGMNIFDGVNWTSYQTTDVSESELYAAVAVANTIFVFGRDSINSYDVARPGWNPPMPVTYGSRPSVAVGADGKMYQFFNDGSGYTWSPSDRIPLAEGLFQHNQGGGNNDSPVAVAANDRVFVLGFNANEVNGCAT